MKTRPILLLFCVALSLVAGAQEQRSGWDNYRPRTLQSIIDYHESAVAELDSSKNASANKLLLTADAFPSRVSLVFLGKTRAVTGKRKELLGDWKKMRGDAVPDDIVGMFGTEMLFKNGTHEFWIAVQKPLLEPLTKEVKVGDSFTAYVIWMGAIKDGKSWDWLFAMNEYDAPDTEKQEPPPPPQSH